VIVGAGDGPCLVLAVGSRGHATRETWGVYPRDETALRHGAGVEEDTNDPRVAYAQYAEPQPARLPDGLLP
jgi:hypothetical protein